MTCLYLRTWIIQNELGVLLKYYVLYKCIQHILAGGFNYFLVSSPLGEDSRFDYSNIFQMGWNQPPVFFQTETYGPLVWGAKRIVKWCREQQPVRAEYPLKGAGVIYIYTTYSYFMLCYSYSILIWYMMWYYMIQWYSYCIVLLVLLHYIIIKKYVEDIL